MKNKILTTLGFLLGTICHAAPNPPSDPQVVPRYDSPITLVVRWTDNSGDETGFEIGRRQEGGVFASLANVAANVTSYVDTTATADRMWEYRVRALGGAAGNSAWTATSNASSPKIVWLMSDGSHNVLDNYGQPLGSAANVNNIYYHDGVDVSGSGVKVVAPRGGVVASVTAAANGTVLISVDVGAAGMFTDVIGHIDNPAAVLGTGDVLAPGDDLADVCDTCWSRDLEADHTHWETELTAGGGKISVLSLYSANADRDPNDTAPVVADVNGDGKDFIVVSASSNNHASPRAPAWGDVDFLVDAYDDMSGGNALNHSPHRIAYWIQPGLTGAASVKSAVDPYVLLEHDYQLCGSPCSPEVSAMAALYGGLATDLSGINTWQSYLTYVITNTNSTDGDPANVDAGQFWRTDAREGTGTRANRSDAGRARENQEARFPDGTYFVHVLLEDFNHQSDTVRSVLVDNSRPYVERVTVFSGPRIVYQDRWVWNAGTARLEPQPSTFDAAAAFTALRTQDVIVEVEFSEPMATASIDAVTPAAGVTALGVTPTLTSTEPAHARKVWRGTISNLDIADDGSHDGRHMLTFNGTDLAGNPLLRINSRTAMGADHHNREAGGNLRGTAGTDTIHGFRIGPLSGVIPVTAIFMKQNAADPATPTIATKSLSLQNALNQYFAEVSYGEISFAVTGHGWYQLDHPLAWYEAPPQTPLVDLVQEAIDSAVTDGVAVADTDYVLVVTDENVARDEWSTTGGWPYTVAGSPGFQWIASGTLNLASTDARVTHLAGRLVGLVDLFKHPEVTITRPFVGPWSHMSDKETEVHVLGWEKWRVGWLDETGTATGKTLTRVAKPPAASPISNQSHTLQPLDSNDNGTKMVAIELADGLHYTATYRRESNLDNDLPSAGVLLVKANDRVNTGEGPAIVQESPVTSGNLDDAPFILTAPRNSFSDVGSGVQVEVTSLDANQAQIRLNYAVPATQNDVYVADHDDRWKTDDIWVDAPDLSDNFAADPRTVRTADELPVVGHLNRLVGRVRNQGRADATNFEVELEILEPWGSGGPWRSLKVETVPLLQGQDTDPSDDFLIIAEWTPTASTHTCVRLRVRTVPNDVNPDNNFTQENIHDFDTSRGSPYKPIKSRFQFENPFNETLPILFRVDGLPDAWTYSVTPARPVLAAGAVGEAEITIQPNDEAPLCTEEEVTLTAYAPRVDTLKRLGGITLATHLVNPGRVTATTRLDCPQGDGRQDTARDGVNVQKPCRLITRGCTDPGLPNTQIAILYTAPDGSTHVRYVMTDADGCFEDLIPGAVPGLWQTEVVLEREDCRAGDRTDRTPVFVPPPGFGRRGLRYLGVFTGGNWPLGKTADAYDPAFTFFADLEWPIRPQWRAGIQIGFHELDAEPSLAIDNLGVTNLSAIFRLQGAGGNAKPFVLGGLGGYESDGTWEPGIQVGLGIEVPISAPVSLAAGITAHQVRRSGDQEDLRFFDAYLGFLVALP